MVLVDARTPANDAGGSQGTNHSSGCFWFYASMALLALSRSDEPPHGGSCRCGSILLYRLRCVNDRAACGVARHVRKPQPGGTWVWLLRISLSCFSRAHQRDPHSVRSSPRRVPSACV